MAIAGAGKKINFDTKTIKDKKTGSESTFVNTSKGTVITTKEPSSSSGSSQTKIAVVSDAPQDVGQTLAGQQIQQSRPTNISMVSDAKADQANKQILTPQQYQLQQQIRSGATSSYSDQQAQRNVALFSQQIQANEEQKRQAQQQITQAQTFNPVTKQPTNTSQTKTEQQQLQEIYSYQVPSVQEQVQNKFQTQYTYNPDTKPTVPIAEYITPVLTPVKESYDKILSSSIEGYKSFSNELEKRQWDLQSSGESLLQQSNQPGKEYLIVPSIGAKTSALVYGAGAKATEYGVIMPLEIVRNPSVAVIPVAEGVAKRIDNPLTLNEDKEGIIGFGQGIAKGNVDQLAKTAGFVSTPYLTKEALILTKETKVAGNRVLDNALDSRPLKAPELATDVATQQHKPGPYDIFVTEYKGDIITTQTGYKFGVRRVKEPSLTSPSSILDYLKGKKPGQIKYKDPYTTKNIVFEQVPSEYATPVKEQKLGSTRQSVSTVSPGIEFVAERAKKGGDVQTKLYGQQPLTEEVAARFTTGGTEGGGFNAPVTGRDIYTKEGRVIPKGSERRYSYYAGLQEEATLSELMSGEARLKTRPGVLTTTNVNIEKVSAEQLKLGYRPLSKEIGRVAGKQAQSGSTLTSRRSELETISTVGTKVTNIKQRQTINLPKYGQLEEFTGTQVKFTKKGQIEAQKFSISEYERRIADLEKAKTVATESQLKTIESTQNAWRKEIEAQKLEISKFEKQPYSEFPAYQKVEKVYSKEDVRRMNKTKDIISAKESKLEMQTPKEQKLNQKQLQQRQKYVSEYKPQKSYSTVGLARDISKISRLYRPSKETSSGISIIGSSSISNMKGSVSDISKPSNVSFKGSISSPSSPSPGPSGGSVSGISDYSKGYSSSGSSSGSSSSGISSITSLISPPSPSIRFSNKEIPADKLAYDVYVRQKGKEVKINKQPLGFNEAIKKSKEIDQTVEASTEIRPKGYNTKGDIPAQEYGDKFRLRKTNKALLFVEKSKYRIDSTGEKQGLSLAKQSKGLNKLNMRL